MTKPLPRTKVLENLGSVHYDLTDIPLEQVVTTLQEYINSHPGKQLSLNLTYEMDYQYPTPLIQLMAVRDENDEEYGKRVNIHEEMKAIERKKKKEARDREKEADMKYLQHLKERYPEEFK